MAPSIWAAPVIMFLDVVPRGPGSRRARSGGRRSRTPAWAIRDGDPPPRSSGALSIVSKARLHRPALEGLRYLVIPAVSVRLAVIGLWPNPADLNGAASSARTSSSPSLFALPGSTSPRRARLDPPRPPGLLRPLTSGRAPRQCCRGPRRSEKAPSSSSPACVSDPQLVAYEISRGGRTPGFSIWVRHPREVHPSIGPGGC